MQNPIDKVDYGDSWVSAVGGALVKAGVFMTLLEFVMHHPTFDISYNGWLGKNTWQCYSKTPYHGMWLAWEAKLVRKAMGAQLQQRRIQKVRVLKRASARKLREQTKLAAHRQRHPAEASDEAWRAWEATLPNGGTV